MDFSAGARSVEAADGTDAQLIDLFFSVFGLDDEAVSLDNVDIRMLQDEAGKLHLVHLVTSPSNGEPQNGHTKETQVHNPPPQSEDQCPPAGIAAVLCRMSKQIKAKVEDWRLAQPNNHPHGKPCAGRLARLFGSAPPSSASEGGIRRPPIKGGPAKFMSRPQFQAHEGHHPYLRHHEHTWVRTAATFLRGLVFGFVIPVIVGVVAGMTASLVGMLVGTLIAWLWVKLVRGGKRGNATARQDARAARCEEEVHVGEKDDLMLEHAPALEDQEAPPVYVEKE